MIYQPPHSLPPSLSTIAWEVSFARLYRRPLDVNTMIVEHACRRSALPEIPAFLTVSTRSR